MKSNNSMGKLVEIPPWVGCVHCNGMVPIPDQIPTDYFQGIYPTCPECKKTFDWWMAILQTIRGNFMLVQALAPVGARWTALKIRLQPNTIFDLKFSDYDIPADAQILSVNYTPAAGGLFPVELHGNVPQRHIIPPVISLYPRPFGEGPHKETQVSVLVTWVPHTGDDEAWQSLIDAFQAYVLGRYESTLVPANVAVESTLSRLLAEFLEKVASRKNVERFLLDGATYSHQLNVLLPALLSFTDAPPLPGNIRGVLNRLRKLRNQMSHKGCLDEPLKKDDTAECLCGALFGFHYLKLIRSVFEGD